jgi:catechol 2,3-dioxygenase-like lactoylglutathione lyase family enzyme
VARLRATGLDVIEDAGAATDRRVGRLARTTAPWGTALEVVLDPADAPTPFSSSLVPGGFLTTGVGFGHVVFATTTFDESVTFVTDGLGFEQSDWLEMELARGITLEVRFFHCNPRHHTVALARAPFELPQVLHHVMFEMNDRDDVGVTVDPDGAGLDRALVDWLATIGGAVGDVAGAAKDLAAWFEAHEVRWALQRPDFHLFGAAADLAGAAALLAELRLQLAPEPRPDPTRRTV